jgi:hypothetical protein
MKHLRLVLCLTVVALFSHVTVTLAESYDSETATVQKSGANTAKIMVGKDTFKAPICFDDGASWDNVKDHYEMNPAAVSGLKAGKMCITVGSDGTLSYKACANKCSMGSKKK